MPLADGTDRRLIPDTEAPPEDMVLIQAPWVGAARDCDGGGCDSLIIDFVSKSPALAPPSDGDLRTFMLYEAYSGESRWAIGAVGGGRNQMKENERVQMREKVKEHEVALYSVLLELN